MVHCAAGAFAVLAPKPGFLREYIAGSDLLRTSKQSLTNHIASFFIRDVAHAGFNYKFACAADRGAALVMKDAGVLEEVHASGIFEDYFKRNHERWVAYAAREGITLNVEELLLVRGFIKTTAWGVAAFVGSSHAQELSFQANSASFLTAQFAISHSFDADPSIERRVGPPIASSSPKPTDLIPDSAFKYNQCVFIHALKCKKRTILPGFRIRAAAEPQDSSYTDDEFPPTPDSVGWGMTEEERFRVRYEFEDGFSGRVCPLLDKWDGAADLSSTVSYRR